MTDNVVYFILKDLSERVFACEELILSLPLGQYEKLQERLPGYNLRKQIGKMSEKLRTAYDLQEKTESNDENYKSGFNRLEIQAV